MTTVLVCLLAGLMMTVASIAARGTDLRSDRTANLRDLIVTQGNRNTELRTEAEALRDEVEQLSAQRFGAPPVDRASTALEVAAGLVAVSGPGFRVVLTDAPNDVRPAGVDDDSLVVHQQDIQAVVNAMWAGGAEAVTIQGQRVIATTGIKCVGNTVVLHGIPYAPPYVIEAIGDVNQIEASIDASEHIQVYLQYVDAYGLGYEEQRLNQIDMPAFAGSVGVTLARSQ
ncbi:hypothetical protein RPIT_12720 [Tessaracoccus flavus]|uniref:Uncharacterized protein n=1 Tax=Tessaracoccus flavus TaxID=1610493 RepID=A0A1Q2CJ48_9ACTN|nr:hypothetical protein RPIT_12720 [Tessaracoccus flavus]SDY78951.1 Uncharacterized conserved protein YlxW, UPF0749 family [Tessaracoccus flavus]